MASEGVRLTRMPDRRDHEVAPRRTRRPRRSWILFVCFVSSLAFVVSRYKSLGQKLKSTLTRMRRPVRIEFGCSHGPFGVKLVFELMPWCALSTLYRSADIVDRVEASFRCLAIRKSSSLIRSP